MTELYYSRLFNNAEEGDGSAAIVGCLPDWLQQSGLTTIQVIYNGPVGIWDWPEQTVNSWWDGMALLSSFKVDVKSKRVTVTKKFLKSDSYIKSAAVGKLVSTEYGTTPGAADPEKGYLSKLVSSLVPAEMTDNDACAVHVYGGEAGSKKRLLAHTETCLLREVDSDTLETKGKVDMSPVVNILSGRPIRDVWTGDTYNLGGSFMTGLKYHFIRFSSAAGADNLPQDGCEVIATLPSRMTTCFSYNHSFGITENYLVMIEQPWVANSLKLIGSKLKGYAFKDCLEWHPEEKNVIRIVEKSTGNEVKGAGRYVTENAFFFLNFVNCFEDGDGNVIIDVVAYDSPDIIDQMYLTKLRQGKLETKDKSRLLRYAVPIQPAAATEGGDNLVRGKYQDILTAHRVNLDPAGDVVQLKPHYICDQAFTGCEHPKVHPGFIGRPYRYCYVVGWVESINRGHFANAVTKVDMETGETTAWRGDEFQHPAEASIVSSALASNQELKTVPDEQEDEGVVICTVTDVRTDQRDFLLIVDARNMTELARSNFDVDIPMSSHSIVASVE